MSGPITPHLSVSPHADGVHIKLKHAEIVVPPEMARSIGELLITCADQHDPSGVTPLPIVKPKGEPIR